MSAPLPFGPLLSQLRRHAGLTQRALATATGFSEAQISRLEGGLRLPDLALVAAAFAPALGLAPGSAQARELLSAAAAARGLPPEAAEAYLTPTLETPPPLPTAYVRRQALETLRRELEQAAALQVVGLPGLGKTTLAAALAHAAPLPVFWLTLDQGATDSSAVLIQRLALFFAQQGAPDMELLTAAVPGESLPAPQQRSLLGAVAAAHPALLCIDKADLLLADPALPPLIETLAATPGTRLLLLSREHLPLPVAVWPIPPLSAPEAYQLLGALCPALPGSQRAALATECGGNPSLLRLVAAQHEAGLGPDSAALSAAPILAEYLASTTLAALGPAARRLVDVLAVADAPLDLTAPEVNGPLLDLAPNEDWAAGIAELARRSLIDDPRRACLPQPIRDYAAQRLDAAWSRRLHAALAAWSQARGGDPLRSARHLTHAGQPRAAAEALVRALDLLLARGQALIAADLVAAILPEVSVESPGLAAQLLCLRGDLLIGSTRSAEAEQNYAQALELATSPALRGQLTWRLASGMLQRGQVQAAAVLLERALADDADDPMARPHLLVNQAQALLMQSRFPAALQVVDEARAAAQDPRLPPQSRDVLLARIAAVQGIVLHITRAIDDSVAMWRQAISLAERCGAIRLRYRSMANLGNVLYEQGDFAGALTQLSPAISGLRLIGDSYAAARALHTMGMIHHLRTEWAEALAALDEALALKTAIGDVQGLANSRDQRAIVLLSLGRVAEALELAYANADAASTGERRAQCQYADTLACALLLAGEIQAALDLLATVSADPAAQADARLHGFLTNHHALALVAAAAPEAARALLAAAPEPQTSEVRLERSLVLALANQALDERATAQSLLAAVASAAANYGYMQLAAAAERIAAAQTPAPKAAPWLLFAYVAPPA